MHTITKLGLVAVAITAGAAFTMKPQVNLKNGDKAPNFQGLDSAGKSHSLKSLTQKGAVHLYFIGDGCPVNHRAVPFFKKVDEAYKGKSNIVGVINGDAAAAKAWAKRYGTKFPILVDPDLKIIRAYGAERSPWAISVGKDGKVMSNHRDGSAKEMKSLNESIAKGLKVKAANISFDGAPVGGG